MVDVLCMTGTLNYTIGQNKTGKVSGLKQLVQTIAIEFLKDPNLLLGTGAGGGAVKEAHTLEDAKYIAMLATDIAKQNIIANQTQTAQLSSAEALSDLRYKGVTKGADGGYEVTLEVTTVAGDTATVTV